MTADRTFRSDSGTDVIIGGQKEDVPDGSTRGSDGRWRLQHTAAETARPVEFQQVVLRATIQRLIGELSELEEPSAILDDGVDKIGDFVRRNGSLGEPALQALIELRLAVSSEQLSKARWALFYGLGAITIPELKRAAAEILIGSSESQDAGDRFAAASAIRELREYVSPGLLERWFDIERNKLVKSALSASLRTVRSAQTRQAA